MAVNEFANLTGVSDKKLPRAQAIIVFETMMELHRNGLLAEVPSLEDLIKIIPTNTRDIRSTCQTYNDYLLTQSAQRSLDAAICITDAGAAGNKKVNYCLFAGFDHLNRRIWEFSVGGEPVTGGGKNVAKLVEAHAKQLNVTLIGSTTDNASDVIKVFVAEMQKSFANFVAVGCVLHILNLVLMNSYHSTFGLEEMGVCSALRCGYIIHYLMCIEGHFDQWTTWAKLNGHELIAYKAAGASKSRW
mmetsp:Transcript_37370/g.83626  ORF Transcript_37370/g.83626 Transcript_37370/m.83626 type:complete len:245 (+) Transcript_37370:336-1070(+)